MPPGYDVDGSRESRAQNSNLASILGPQVPWPFLAFDPQRHSEVDHQMSTEGPPVRGGEHMRMGPSARDPARNLPPVWTYHGCCDSELERVRGEEAGLVCGSAPRRCPWEGGGGKMVTTDFRASHLPAHLVLLFSIQPDMCCSHLPQKGQGCGCGYGNIPSGFWLSPI